MDRGGCSIYVLYTGQVLVAKLYRHAATVPEYIAAGLVRNPAELHVYWGAEEAVNLVAPEGSIVTQVGSTGRGALTLQLAK